MLTRLYIDNFRCFEKFEWKPGRKQLILGGNGTGKSSFMDALLFLCEVAVRVERVERWFKLEQRTRWVNQASLILEVGALLNGRNYVYKLVIEPAGDPPRPVVQWEALHDFRSVLEFRNGEVEVASPNGGPVVTWKFDPSRSALSSGGAVELVEFRNWLAGVSCWHINPISMGSRAEVEERVPRVDLANFAAWYRHLARTYPEQNTAFLQDLRQVLLRFEALVIENAGEDVRLLFAEFCSGGSRVRFGFGELSDGQRCLICLYAVAHFVAAKGGTVIIDEPDNFISLAEIQPWLNRIEELADDHGGQVILISHHPEILNQWAPAYGVKFIREGAGPVRIQKFKGDPESPLSAAELVARGWDLE